MDSGVRKLALLPVVLALLVSAMAVVSFAHNMLIVPALPTYGSALPQFQLPHIQNGLFLMTAAADFNCDGRTDVLLVRGIWGTNTPVPVTVALSDGLGGYIDGTSSIFPGGVPAPVWPRKLVVDDFNGDGRPDVFVADHGNDDGAAMWPGHQNELILSTNTCQLLDATANLPQQSDFTHTAASADIDNDGDVDIYDGNIWGINNIPPQIWLNDGTGKFTIASGRLPAAQTNLDQNRYTASLLVDVTGDDNPDLILGGQDYNPNQSVVLVNDGAGCFSVVPNAIPAKPFGSDAIALDIQSADFNHDGWNDLVIVFTKTSYTGRWEQILINNGNGTFSDQTASLLPQVNNSSNWDIFAHLVDFDGDGNHDLIAESIAGGTNSRYYTANGSGQFTSVSFLNGVLPNAFALAGASADGHRDLVTFGYNNFGFEQAWVRRETSAALTPGVPLGVRASRGLFGHIRIFWPFVWGATSYQVWRSATPGSEGSLIATVAGPTTFDDGTATQGVKWYYRVRAVNGTGTSGASAVTYGFASPQFVQNGTFGSGTTGWTVYGAPTPSDIQWSVSNGVFQFSRGLTANNTAAIFQETNVTLPTDTGVTAQFDIGNSSNVRRRISVLLIEKDFSDITVCTFWLAPQAPLRTYRMTTHSTKPWTLGAAIYFYAATQDLSGGSYLLANVSVKQDAQSLGGTRCFDPTAPVAPGGPEGPGLMQNPDFGPNGGTLASWSVFNNITYFMNGAFYFYRAPSALPAGGILQNSHVAVPAGSIVTAWFTLGNTSSVRKRVTILLMDGDYSDLAACTFWIPPGLQPPNSATNYLMRTFATKNWNDATFALFAATVDTEQWSALDNIIVKVTPAMSTSGTDCAEPGGQVQSPAPSPLAVSFEPIQGNATALERWWLRAIARSVIH